MRSAESCHDVVSPPPDTDRFLDGDAASSSSSSSSSASSSAAASAFSWTIMVTRSLISSFCCLRSMPSAASSYRIRGGGSEAVVPRW